ncbi:Nitroreductase [Anaerobranca californiensis DSM 14826]|jgi:nitroreductase|uniref:Nitroreductase n=1 Tax=Anaerobranca californiensis DSM 14826 TaxID=1120989 RepID=A0A1M6LL07_9FIRM|nr:nitroreductase family protein [Anaerobranca californiensis]SHJ71877.1 Nitroreductase [Anaerobranca californiensis DSM 14826]
MLELLIKRRSIRKFKSDKIEADKLQTLIQAALLSPSSRNIRPWEFIVVENKETLYKLSKVKKHGSSFIKEAPLAIVILGDPNKSDVWIEDTSIAGIIIQLTAEKLGLGSCWVQIRNREHHLDYSAEKYIQKLLEIPEYFKITAVIAIGYPAEEKEPYDIAKLPYEKVKMETFTRKYSGGLK